MTKAITFFMLACMLSAAAQPNADTPVLKQQKEKIIKAETIIKIENIGRNINSELAELRPTISADGNLLFFICENHPYNTKFNSIRNSQDIWYSERDTVTGKWCEAMHMDYPLNTYHYNTVYWISPDNNRILIRNAFIDGDYAGNGVSMSYLKKNGSWSKPQMLEIKNYQQYDRGRQNGASMAHDGQTLLLYMSEQKGGYNNDIYVCFLQPDGTWSEPKSLGKKINLSKYNEMTPYLAADGETLYFSSNRPGGLGDNDIWMTKRLDKTWQKWSEPLNLGSPINTPNWDAFFTLDAGGEYAYMSSSENGFGESDIVRVKLLEKEKPNPVLLVSGNVYNKKTGKPLSASLIYETLPDGTEAGNGISNPQDGAFKIVLPYDKNYLIRATADHFFAQSENLNLDSLVKAGYKEIHKDLYLVPIEIGQVVRLNNVFFDFDKWDLRPESYRELDRVVTLLQENPSIEIEMSAHTDSYGADNYNFKLSDNRARSVKEYILSKGIASSRIISQGYGETKPVAINDTDENRQLNRRVEFKILKN
ncbi:MAG TPA: OmpA family protein [Chitinophagaceae bacterium]|nr:OmpA family protein [Chitinophagaceae bacterium]